MQILESENTISKDKMYQMDSIVNLRWQKKESVNLKIDQNRVSNIKNREKK